MASTIKKIRLINFRRFRDYTIEPNDRINILVGDNEVGKSSVLEAIDIVANGNVHRVESIGLDKLLNIEAVRTFMSGVRDYENLPKLIIELYLSGEFDHSMNGKNNTDGVICDGIRMVCAPNPDYRNEIKEALTAHEDYFPYDYYSIRFSTFADEGYTGYKKKLRCTFIDSSNMDSEYATKDFVRRMYMQYTESNVKERTLHKSQYRLMRNNFRTECLKSLNERLPVSKKYTFGLKGGTSMELERDLMIFEDDIGIDKSGQLFITTHNSLISTRLELNNLLIMHINGEDKPIMLNALSDETAKYFMKAPPASIVEYSLSQKAILVEGPSEYMLLDKFYKSISNNSPEEDNVHIIDIRGLSFKRYLDIAKLTGSKVAIITDNDEDAQKHCVEKYAEYADYSNIKIFYESDNTKYTFEIVLYHMNKDLCNQLFKEDALEYMLKNKTEAAYTLLTQNQPINVPDYIKRAIDWIRR